MFGAGAIDALRGIFAEVCADAPATWVEMDGEDDHVRWLIHDSFAVGASLPAEGRGLPRVPVIGRS